MTDATPIGRSDAHREALRRIRLAARTDVPVLLEGESGVGKEVLARWLHRTSSRRAGPFVAVNAAAVPEHLLESELFGHERGSFTGADRRHAGLFVEADGGTLLIDEIGDLPLALQAKLLRVIQDGEVRPVGGTHARRVDVRLVSATHRDLRQLVGAGTFRADLWYRLAVFVVEVPPLRRRLDDLPLLVDGLLRRHGRPGVRLSDAARRRLWRHDWPGNVRELENALRHALVLCGDGERILETHLPDHVGVPRLRSVPLLTLEAVRRDAERRRIVEALEDVGGNRTRAAARLGVSRQALHARLKVLGIGPAVGRSRGDARGASDGSA